jgi:hypothetical protein
MLVKFNNARILEKTSTAAFTIQSSKSKLMSLMYDLTSSRCLSSLSGILLLAITGIFTCKQTHIFRPVTSVADPGCLSQIPDPEFYSTGKEKHGSQFTNNYSTFKF